MFTCNTSLTWMLNYQMEMNMMFNPKGHMWLAVTVLLMVLFCFCLLYFAFVALFCFVCCFVCFSTAIFSKDLHLWKSIFDHIQTECSLSVTQRISYHWSLKS